MNNEILITHIQRCCFHDGPGIRTTVFLKGCSLKCPWCSNPENIDGTIQSYEIEGIKGTYGVYISPDELVAECLKDKPYYFAGDNCEEHIGMHIDNQIPISGGVTFSGGEPLLQMTSLIPVCDKLHKQSVHICVETSLCVSDKCLDYAISNIDLFYVDLKILDPARENTIGTGYRETFLHNYEVLHKSEKPIVARVPVIGSYTDNNENRVEIFKLLSGMKPIRIELLKEHNLAEKKYRSLGKSIEYQGVEDGFMNEYKAELEVIGIPIEICAV